MIDDKWIEIDINAVKYNLKVVRSLLNQQTRLIAVVKANGYGHGTCMVAGILADCGVDFFAVTFLEEALELRKAGIKGNILVFSPLIDEEKIITAVKEKLTLTITSPYDGELIDNVTRANKLPVTVHIKIDTGLGRFGLNLEEALQICHSLKQNPSIYMEGIYTHMSEGAAKRPEYTRNQFYLFMQDLSNEVKRTRADLGIGIDGDGDRLGVVDPEGNLIWGDMLMILFWRQILPKYPGSKCIVEVKCSQSLIDEIKRLGGEPIMYKTGHSLIKAKMKEIGAIFTGEMSGHMFFADEYYGFDDAIYAGARLLSLLSHSNQNLTQLLKDVPRYYSTPEIRVPSTDEEKFALVDKVLKHFQAKYEVIDIDGARIVFPHGWGLVRASNTGPELIVRCEGNTPETLENIKNELFGYLEELGLTSESLRKKAVTV